MQQRFACKYRFRAKRSWLTLMSLFFACNILMPAFAHAAQATFRWDYTASGAAGFMLYCGLSSSGAYSAVVDVGNTDVYTLAGLSRGAVYQCVVTAYDARRSQSDYSNAIRLYIAASGLCAKGCNGDLNRDGVVNALDLDIIKGAWGTSDPDADLNGDGIVNVLDFSIFRLLLH